MVSERWIERVHRLNEDDVEGQVRTLVGMANDLSDAHVDAETRAYVRPALIDYVERDRFSVEASTAVWVLGKLFDPTLEDYFAELAAAYLQRRLDQHFRQAAIGLDNLEVLAQPRSSDFDAFREVVSAYLQRRS